MRTIHLVAAIAALAGAPSAYSQTTWGTYEQPLEGRRYETMRALANYVDEQAQDAYNAARQDSRRGSRAARNLLPALRSFATLAADFHDRMDAYQATAADVPDEVETLFARARRVDTRIRAGRGFTSTSQIWADVMDGLQRMQRVVAGQDVEVPYGAGASADYDRDYGPFGARPSRPTVPGGLAGEQLAQFNELAHSFSTAVYRTYEVAWRQQRNTPGGEAIVSQLRTLYQDALNIHQRADADAIDPREVRPTVERLLTQARQVDQNMRAQRAYQQVWDNWTRAVEIVNQMVALVR